MKLEGNGHKIVGSGPYVSTPPYSYGINLGSVSNVIINGILVSKFSYGIYINNSYGNLIENSTVQNITISGVYFAGSRNNLLAFDLISSVYGTGGAVSIQSGGNNTISGSSLKYNSYYAMIINSTGNRVSNDTMVGNPIDLACTSSSGYASYNKFSNTTCYVNHYCNFATCTEQNIPNAPQAVVLSSHINECGFINFPGTYSLTSNLNTPNFIQSSPGNSTPCITINASNVDLNCNGFTISNGSYAIYASGLFNLSVSDCGLSGNNYGAYFAKILKFNLRNITATGNNYGIYMLGSTGGNFSDIVGSKNKYGVYVNGSTYTTLTRFTTTNNTYGIFMDNSTSVSMDSGTSLLNSKADLYCSASVYNSTLSSISDSKCSTTDCIWAGICPIHYLPNLSTYPITQCTAITVPGQYSLNTNLNANGNCFTVATSNVSIQCNSHAINGFGSGSAVVIDNVSNVAVFGCKVSDFADGVSSSNSQYVVVQNMQMRFVSDGINFANVQSALVSNNLVSNFTNSAFVLSGTSKSVISSDIAESGSTSSGSAFSLLNDINNTVLNNTALNNKGYGFSFTGTTQSNLVLNNTASQNSAADYICSSGSASPYANSGHVNNGVTKINCRWLAAIPTPLLQVQCSLITSPSTIILGYDMYYPYGNTCFTLSSKNASINAQNSVINCNGHTIYSSNGGTFVRITNTSSVTVENCILYGFSTPIVVTSKIPQTNIKLINNTIINSNVSITATQAHQSTISNDNITNAVTGILATSFNSSSIRNNIISATTNAITVRSSSDVTLQGNSATATNYALSLSNTSSSSLQNNNLHGTASGAYCAVSSASKSTGNVDLGGNACSSTSCLWITSSGC